MLKKLQAQNFDEVYSIMEEAFPIDERRPYEEQKALLSREAYCIYILQNTDSDEIKAFITVYRFPKFAYVEHFATNRKFRNQGLGAVVLKELSGLLSCGICLEVELPETEIAKRRIAFYKRNGFYLNEFSYMQPPISMGKRAIPLLIMTSGGRVTQGEFEKIKSVLYQNVYGIK